MSSPEHVQAYGVRFLDVINIMRPGIKPTVKKALLNPAFKEKYDAVIKNTITLENYTQFVHGPDLFKHSLFLGMLSSMDELRITTAKDLEDLLDEVAATKVGRTPLQERIDAYGRRYLESLYAEKETSAKARALDEALCSDKQVKSRYDAIIQKKMTFESCMNALWSSSTIPPDVEEMCKSGEAERMSSSASKEMRELLDEVSGPPIQPKKLTQRERKKAQALGK